MLTVLADGTMVPVAEAVLRAKGVDAQIIDLRTLVPLDIEAIGTSVGKTGRCHRARSDAHIERPVDVPDGQGASVSKRAS